MPINDNKLNIQIKTTLIAWYGHSKDIDVAKRLYNSVKDCDKDIYCIDTMMEAYCNNDMNSECIELYKSIYTINNKLKPDLVSYVTLLKACTNSTNLYYGKLIHQELEENIEET